jgi:hypothetical protein
MPLPIIISTLICLVPSLQCVVTRNSLSRCLRSLGNEKSGNEIVTNSLELNRKQ